MVVVRPLIEHYHYLHSMPAAASRCFGVYLGRRLKGAVVLTPGARNGHRVLAAARHADVLTLARLWLSDDLPKNSESRVLGIVLRMLRREGRPKAVLTYADPAAGHLGTIYMASGFRYLGQSPPEPYVAFADGSRCHPRSVFSRYGSNAIRHLRATGVPLVGRTWVPGKHRFLYVLDRAWVWRIRDGTAGRGPPHRPASSTNG